MRTLIKRTSRTVVQRWRRRHPGTGNALGRVRRGRRGHDADPVEMYLQDIFTVTREHGRPAGHRRCLPVWSSEGLPLGLQLIGRAVRRGLAVFARPGCGKSRRPLQEVTDRWWVLIAVLTRRSDIVENGYNNCGAWHIHYVKEYGTGRYVRYRVALWPVCVKISAISDRIAFLNTRYRALLVGGSPRRRLPPGRARCGY